MLSFLLLISDPVYQDKIMYIYRTFHDDMCRLALQRFVLEGRQNAEADAEDVVQGAFLKIVKYIDSFPSDMNDQRLKAYVMAILSHEIYDFKADNATFDRADGDVECIPDGDFFERMRIRERYEEVVDAIEHLDERYSVVMLLHYREEMSVKEIAKMLGLPEKTIYTRLARGKKKLLEVLGRDA